MRTTALWNTLQQSLSLKVIAPAMVGIAAMAGITQYLAPAPSATTYTPHNNYDHLDVESAGRLQSGKALRELTRWNFRAGTVCTYENARTAPRPDQAPAQADGTICRSITPNDITRVSMDISEATMTHGRRHAITIPLKGKGVSITIP